MKTVLITGSSTGIGYAAASYLVDKGYFVFGSVRDDAARARLEHEFPAASFRALRFDVTDPSAVDAAAGEVRQALEGDNLDALVNNAGLAVAGPLQLLDDDEFRKQMEVGLFAVRTVTNAFLPLLGGPPSTAGTPGRIINMSSISGILNTPMNGAYCVTKHAVESLGEVYRRELMGYGIDVVSIRAGPIQSCIWDKNMNALDAYAETAYATMAANTKRIIADAQKHALPARTISRLIHKIIEARRPRCAYIVNRNRWAPALLAHYLPARLVDRLIWRTLNR